MAVRVPLPVCCGLRVSVGVAVLNQSYASAPVFTHTRSSVIPVRHSSVRQERDAQSMAHEDLRGARAGPRADERGAPSPPAPHAAARCHARATTTIHRAVRAAARASPQAHPIPVLEARRRAAHSQIDGGAGGRIRERNACCPERLQDDRERALLSLALCSPNTTRRDSPHQPPARHQYRPPPYPPGRPPPPPP